MKHVQFVEPANEIVRLDVMVETGSVTIRPSASKEIIIDATYRHMDVWVEQRDNSLVVRAEQDETFLQKASRLFRNDQPKATLIIQVPASCEINAKTITGQLDITGIQAAVTGRVITGRLHLTDIDGPIYAKTIAGKLRYTGGLSEDKHRFETITGDLQLTLPLDTGATLSAATTTGKIRCRLLLTHLQKQPGFIGEKLQGTLGSGAGYIKAKVTTGNLLLKPLQEKEPEWETAVADSVPV